MTVDELARELAKVQGADRQKEVVCQTTDKTTFEAVIGVQDNEDTFALFTRPESKP